VAHREEETGRDGDSSPLPQKKATLTNLLAELKSLFFYEEAATLRDQLRSLVTKYEVLAKEERAVVNEQRSRSTSLDTKDRLKAFISRQDFLNRRGESELQTGSVTLKNATK